MKDIDAVGMYPDEVKALGDEIRTRAVIDKLGEAAEILEAAYEVAENGAQVDRGEVAFILDRVRVLSEIVRQDLADHVR